MIRRLPPLNALRAYEAAARHHSFTRAAEELHVTQAAISHQVRQLEEWLGCPLFERRGHALTGTTVGKAYATELGRLLDALVSATERVAGHDSSLDGPLRITVLPSFATRWLVPRLARFRALHPGIDLQVTSTLALHDFARDGFDLAIRLGLGRWPGLQTDLISRERLSPVCSPELLAHAPLATVADLQAPPLLHDQPGDLWPRWLALAGATRGEADAIMRAGLAFSDSALVLQAAADGQGVALGRLFLAAADITAGRLVKPFALDLPNDYSYWLAYPPAAAQQPRLAAFRHWVLAETSPWRDA
ncbi:MAG: transcriptional regulator GcvA [Bordetella sp.]|uniref:transcriptional regulator GcvA n=1 Tax=Bordetella sp. TaxID=28081 RepID=UPI003F7BFFAC